MARTITITVPKIGLALGKAKIKIEADGFVGSSCAVATANIAAALGPILSQEHKAEFYQEPPLEEHLRTDG